MVLGLSSLVSCRAVADVSNNNNNNNNNNNDDVFKIYTGSSSTDMVKAKIRYTCDNECRMVNIGRDGTNITTFWELDGKKSAVIIRQRLVDLKPGDYVLSMIAVNGGDKGMITASISFNDMDVIVSNKNWRVITKGNPEKSNKFGWRNDFNYKPSTDELWDAPCVYSALDGVAEIVKVHPDWQAREINKKVATSSTLIPDYIWNVCQSSNNTATGPAFFRLRFSVIQGAKPSVDATAP